MTRNSLNYRYLLAVALIVPLFSSCIKDPSNTVRLPDELEKGRVVFHINIPRSSLPSSRAIADGGVDDNVVDEVTLLLFEPSDYGSGAYLGEAVAAEIETDGSDSQSKTFSVLIPDGEFDALVIANADDILSQFKTDNTGYASEDMVFFEQNLTTTIIGGNSGSGYLEWNSSPGSTDYKPFPMAARFEIPAERGSGSMETVFLIRMLSKINVKIAFGQTYTGTADDTDIFRLNSIVVPNFNTTGNLIPGDAGGKALSVFDPSQLNLPSTPGTVYGRIGDLVYSGTQIQSVTVNSVVVPGQQCVDEIFLPEKAGVAGSDNITCVLVEVYHPLLGENRWFRVDLQMPDPANEDSIEPVDMLRNFRYTLNITAIDGNGFATAQEAYDAPAEGVLVDITAIDESDMNDITFDGRNQLTTNASYFVFRDDDPGQTLKVFTDYSGGWDIVSNTATDWLSVPTTEGQGAVTTPVSLIPATNVGNTVLTGTIVIEAGALRKTINVIQVPLLDNITADAAPPSGFTPYVGAFWRSNQIGERLIRITRPTGTAADGDWAAIVMEGEDWIVMDTLMTTDPNVGWRVDAVEALVESGNDADFDKQHPVIGRKEWVHGTMNDDDTDIYFRLGLNGPHAPDSNNPARYGVVLLAYNNYTKLQRIWIRQGEGPDYLFRPDDPVNSAGITERTAAVPFSAYNLTAETLNAQVYQYGTTTGGTTASKFTEYPTQGGALFAWGLTNAAVRYAWDLISVSPPNWILGALGGSNKYWSGIGANNETCPQGYRRPNDGPTNKANAMTAVSDLQLSELRQSLFDKFQTGNTNMNITNKSAGYYADGFFDRRSISADGRDVSTSSNDVSSYGFILFNTANQASLFFPLVNRSRNGNTASGAIYKQTYYLTTGSSSLGIAVVFSDGNIAGILPYIALSVRCVADI
uniref:DUF4906 domain-containing protein n=1 Tax=uncultured bacterium contig00003(2014) TaxID=1465624 RepID=A0A060CSH0_9BACT|nr:hypothetical protein [uncultured bacterium contig00003(2014)]